MAQRVVKDLEEAELILRETIDATWDSTVKHPEAAVIVASAMVAFQYKEKFDELESRVESLFDTVDQIANRP
jgi:translation elongation factor EF-Tu-like GTPase